MNLAAGTVISHYRIDRQLGAGGMGEVYLAQDLSLHRPVALKLLSAPDDGNARKRLMQEARAAAALDHPLICAVHEVGTDPGHGDFIAMQYIDGEPLSLRLHGRRMAPAAALTVCQQITEALRVAHRAGVVHRDLKPHNIMVTPDGDVKLLDFGIAKQIFSKHDAAEMATASQLTYPDVLMGTPGYMAPEQARNQPADYRSDIFALGCIVYECLTGRRAFSGQTTADVLGQLMQVDPPPPSAVVPELGTAYDSLCARMLKKDAAERFQSADEVMGALHALMPAGTSVSSASASAPVTVRGWPMSRRATLAWAIPAVLVIGLSIWAWQRPRDLPAAPDDAAYWYGLGVEALRQGTYVAARSALEKATEIYPTYVEALARLADARLELDDPEGARDAIIRLGQAIPNRTRLRTEPRLRVEAVESYVLHDYDASIAKYRALAALRRDDARGWLDVGRTQEAAGRIGDARTSYEQAVRLDGQYAAAHLRLGAAQGTPQKQARAELDEAARLYRTATNTEGEAEALVRKGIWLSGLQAFAEARDVLTRAATLTADPRFAHQHVRAMFELASVTASLGDFTGAIDLGQQAFDQATRAGLQAAAANGLVNLGNTLMLAGKTDEAGVQLSKAQEMAASHRATRTEQRAKLAQASLLVQTGRPAEGIARAAEPLKYFTDNGWVRNMLQAQTIMSRGNERLENYDAARKITEEVLAFARKVDDRGSAALSMDGIASQLTKLGALPEALTQREQTEALHRELKDTASLAFDLTNRAELLVNLGRGGDSDVPLLELERDAATIQAYANRRDRIALVRSLRSCIDGRFLQAEKLADEAGAGKTTSTTALYATVLREFARANLRTSKEPLAVIAAWVDIPSTPAIRREIAYWVGQTLLVRRGFEQALSMLSPILDQSATGKNLEASWRLAGLAALANDRLAKKSEAAALSTRATAAIKQLEAAWASSASQYFARPDLQALRKLLSVTASGH